jgi:hypothetical protein
LKPKACGSGSSRLDIDSINPGLEAGDFHRKETTVSVVTSGEAVEIAAGVPADVLAADSELGVVERALHEAISTNKGAYDPVFVGAVGVNGVEDIVDISRDSKREVLAEEAIVELELHGAPFRH